MGGCQCSFADHSLVVVRRAGGGEMVVTARSASSLMVTVIESGRARAKIAERSSDGRDVKMAMASDDNSDGIVRSDAVMIYQM